MDVQSILAKMQKSEQYTDEQLLAIDILLHSLEKSTDDEGKTLLQSLMEHLNNQHPDPVPSESEPNTPSFSATFTTSILKTSSNTGFYIKDLVNLDKLFLDDLSHLSVSAPRLPEDNMFTPCQYLTFDGSTFSLISSHYHYANPVKNIGICSHPQRSAKSKAISYCSTIGDQPSCADYSYAVEVLAHATVQPPNTNTTEQYQLNYHAMINFYESSFVHVYSIVHVASGSTVNELKIPDAMHDDVGARAEAQRVFDEYIVAYAETEVVVDDTPASVVCGQLPLSTPVASYFGHILSTV